MKRVLFVAVVCAMVFGSCSNVQRENELTAENDSLQQVINDRDAEIDEIVGTVNLIQEGFNRINEAEGRITVDNSSLENVGKRQAVVENMEFIEQSLAQNREMIARLKEQLEESKVGGEKLQRMVDNLQAQLDNQTLRVQELEAILAERDIVIAQQSDTIVHLSGSVSALTKENMAQEQTIGEQDALLHAAWYVFGTKSELKEQNILKSGDVLQSDDFNRSYFTQIDIRLTREIKLYSKSATLLTSHPAGSYTLERDNNKEYVLQIVDVDKFWSVSKYLVIQVK